MKPQPLLFGRVLVLSRDSVVLLPWRYGLVVNIAVLVDHKAALVFCPVCPQEGGDPRRSVGASAATQECNQAGGGEREAARDDRAEEGWGFAPADVLRSPAGSSARAVGGRRLPSTDAHDQFLCKRRSRTGEGADRRGHGGRKGTFKTRPLT